MDAQLSGVRRHPDGAIDFDFYRRRAMALRRRRMRYFYQRNIRRKFHWRGAIYAAALCIGLAIGETMPLPPPDCLNCLAVDIDLDAARHGATERDGYVAITSQISPTRPQAN